MFAASISAAISIPASVGTTLLVVLTVWKWKKVGAFFRGEGAAAVMETTADTVDILKTAVDELRTQLGEARATIDELVKKNVHLEQVVRVLEKQVTAEAPLRELTIKVEELTNEIRPLARAIQEKL